MDRLNFKLRLRKAQKLFFYPGDLETCTMAELVTSTGHCSCEITQKKILL